MQAVQAMNATLVLHILQGALKCLHYPKLHGLAGRPSTSFARFEGGREWGKEEEQWPEKERGKEGRKEKVKGEKKTTPKNKNQMHKSQWQDLLKPRSKFFFFFFLYA